MIKYIALFLLLVNLLVSTFVPIHHNYYYTLPPKENKLLAGKVVPQGVNVKPYSFEPAPMGISDVGVGPNGPYVRNSTQFLGIIHLYSVQASSTLHTPCVSFQLNLVLNYEYHGNTYALWTQNVAIYDTATNQIIFLDNIWNFTTYDANVTGILGNGQISYDKHAGLYYYYYCSFLPGSNITISLPATIYMLINVTVNSYGQPVIMFWYNDGYGWVNYDRVTVANVEGATNVYFLIDGYKYTGSGNYYDAELVMVGPGGGSCAYIDSSTVYLSLEYWNGHNFQEVRNAYNYGFDTAETTNDALVEPYYNTISGEYVSGIKAGSGQLTTLWTQNAVSVLQILPGVNSGYALVFNASVPFSNVDKNSSTYEIQFSNGEICLTLDPMEYGIIVFNSNGQVVGEASIYTMQGETVSTKVGQFNMSIVNYEVSNNKTVITLRINGYGYVNLSINSSYPYEFQKNPIYVYGKAIDNLTIYNLPYGVHYFSIYGTLFKGFYVKINLKILIVLPVVPITFSYSFIGNQPPKLPLVTLTFPNGTTENITVKNGQTIYLPIGTTYTIQKVIGNNTVRWATLNSTSGTVKLESQINIIYYEQDRIIFLYYLIGNGTFNMPEVTYQLFNITTTIFLPANIWVNYGSTYSLTKVISGFELNTRAILINASNGIITSPEIISVYYQVQDYIKVNSPIPLFALINGKNVSFISNWYNQSEVIEIENLPYYLSSTEREIITSLSPSFNFVVKEPLQVNVSVVKQYFIIVNSNIPVYGIINGKNESLTSTWYNQSTVIQIENLTYYPKPLERFVIVSISPSEKIDINSSITIELRTIKQFFIKINSVVPVFGLINGKNESLVSNWYNNGTEIQVENLTYYVNSLEREVIVSITPRNFTVNNSINVSVKVITQYFLQVVSKIPVKGEINGSLGYLNSSWINEGTKVNVLNYTYYINNETRCVITKVEPSQSFTMNSPITLNVATQKQYLVEINGEASWVNQGTVITLSANVPFYLVGKFVGTYNVTPGAKIQVNEPIYEKLVESPNFIVIGIIAIIIAVVILVIILIKK